MNGLNNILGKFDSSSLDDISDVKLMNRIDTKFIFHKKKLPKILEKLTDEYSILEVESRRISKYKSLYFDTQDFNFYKNHHNKKDHRLKIRKRSYVESDSHFLEVKEKRKGRTVKSRIPIQETNEVLDEKKRSFLKDYFDNAEGLEPKLKNYYNRITLISKNKKERLTLDLGLGFEWKKSKEELERVIIAELKQERIDHSSVFFRIMKEYNIRPYRISKYCIGTLLIHGKEKVKYNRFKEKILTLRKIQNDI